MQRRYTYLIFIAILALSGVLAFDSFRSYINPYLSVSQIITNGDAYRNKEVQILGTIVNGSTNHDDGALLFNLTDGEATVRVTYAGIPLQNFMEGQQAVAIGTYEFSDGVKASQILMKCPSKYESGKSFFAEPVFIAATFMGVAAIGYSVISLFSKKR